MREDSLIVKSVPEAERSAVGKENTYLILEIAYLLASIDGVVRDEEIAEFRATARLLLGEDFDSIEALGFVARTQNLSSIVMNLIKFYSSEETTIKILNHYATPALESIAKAKPNVVRRAFAFWMGMCCADNEYADVERKAMTSLRNSLLACSPELSSHISDDFLTELEHRVLEVNEVERTILDSASVSVEKKDEKLVELMQSFAKFLDIEA